MGIQEIDQSSGEGRQHRSSTRGVLNDLRALEMMLDRGMFESGVTRIGAEQELALVDDAMNPSPLGPELLFTIDDERATSEIGRFNLEFNCSPRELKGSALRDMHEEVRALMGVAREKGSVMGVTPVLIGILPTLATKHLGREYITPKPRYYALDELITKARGGRYDVRIKGIDELSLSHDSVMLEALNTSFQLHFQVQPDSFVQSYNAAQLITAPLMALASNSAVLFGKRLWSETRIAIFEQTVDTSGSDVPAEREMLRRVRYGEQWVRESVLEIFREDLAKFRSLFSPDVEEDSVKLVEEGKVPKLGALQTYNGTIYRWNRACYGITDGKPHLRIENRVLPAGPTMLDECANAALWFGLMNRLPELAPDIPDRVKFADTRSNFIGAARSGLDVKIRWLDGRTVPVRDLLLDELIPIAREGLERASIDKDDIDRYLGICVERTETGRNGARWMIDSVEHIHEHGSRAERLSTLTCATINRQLDDERPIHEWPLAEIEECGEWTNNYGYVGQYMATDLFTVQEDELVDLAASIMDWKRIRHIPVEDHTHRLIGLVSYRALLRVVANASSSTIDDPIPVSEIMNRDPVCVTPETPTLEAIALMKEHKTSCLPVVNKDHKLVGLVTEHDYMRIAGKLLEQQLSATNDPKPGG